MAREPSGYSVPPRTATPAVSPGGGRVAYKSLGLGGTNLDVFVWDAGTNGATNLTASLGSTQQQRPAWSPDGSELIFEGSTLPTGSDLFTVAADGSSSPVNLTSSPDSSEFEPDWGSDGVKELVVYRVANLVGTRRGIRLLIPSTGVIEGLTTTFGDEGPVLSPDGTKVAFARPAGSAFHIWIIDVASKVETQITTGSWADREPAWSPDGAKLVFRTNRTGSGLTAGGLAIVDVGTKVIVPLVDDGGGHLHPTWHD